MAACWDTQASDPRGLRSAPRRPQRAEAGTAAGLQEARQALREAQPLPGLTQPGTNLVAISSSQTRSVNSGSKNFPELS